MKIRILIVACVVFSLAVSVHATPIQENDTPEGFGGLREQVLQISQGYSCSPRRYCSRSISSCAEARWYHQNCSWGGALDRDNDGVPCENLC
jgi:hypothetical protein